MKLIRIGKNYRKPKTLEYLYLQLFRCSGTLQREKNIILSEYRQHPHFSTAFMVFEITGDGGESGLALLLLRLNGRRYGNEVGHLMWLRCCLFMRPRKAMGLCWSLLRRAYISLQLVM